MALNVPFSRVPGGLPVPGPRRPSDGRPVVELLRAPGSPAPSTNGVAGGALPTGPSPYGPGLGVARPVSAETDPTVSQTLPETVTYGRADFRIEPFGGTRPGRPGRPEFDEYRVDPNERAAPTDQRSRLLDLIRAGAGVAQGVAALAGGRQGRDVAAIAGGAAAGVGGVQAREQARYEKEREAYDAWLEKADTFNRTIDLREAEAGAEYDADVYDDAERGYEREEDRYYRTAERTVDRADELDDERRDREQQEADARVRRLENMARQMEESGAVEGLANVYEALGVAPEVARATVDRLRRLRDRQDAMDELERQEQYWSVVDRRRDAQQPYPSSGGGSAGGGRSSSSSRSGSSTTGGRTPARRPTVGGKVGGDTRPLQANGQPYRRPAPTPGERALASVAQLSVAQVRSRIAELERATSRPRPRPADLTELNRLRLAMEQRDEARRRNDADGSQARAYRARQGQAPPPPPRAGGPAPVVAESTATPAPAAAPARRDTTGQAAARANAPTPEEMEFAEEMLAAGQLPEDDYNELEARYRAAYGD
jgi:hypothetical protein